MASPLRTKQKISLFSPILRNVAACAAILSIGIGVSALPAQAQELGEEVGKDTIVEHYYSHLYMSSPLWQGSQDQRDRSMSKDYQVMGMLQKANPHDPPNVLYKIVDSLDVGEWVTHIISESVTEASELSDTSISAEVRVLQYQFITLQRYRIRNAESEFSSDTVYRTTIAPSDTAVLVKAISPEVPDAEEFYQATGVPFLALEKSLLQIRNMQDSARLPSRVVCLLLAKYRQRISVDEAWIYPPAKDMQGHQILKIRIRARGYTGMFTEEMDLSGCLTTSEAGDRLISADLDGNIECNPRHDDLPLEGIGSLTIRLARGISPP